MPKKLLKSCVVSGDFVCVIAETLSESTFSPSGVSLCQKNLQSCDLNCIFLDLSVRLFSLAVFQECYDSTIMFFDCGSICQNVISIYNDTR